MQCESLAEQLTDLMEGLLDEQTEAAALEHLASCSSCEQVLASTRNVVHLVGDHGRAELTVSDRDRMLASILQEVGPGHDSSPSS